MTNQEMMSIFNVGDIVERTPEWMQKNPGSTNHKVKVTGFEDENVCLKVFGGADAGTIRFPETMRVIERDGIRIGDTVHFFSKFYSTVGKVESFTNDGFIKVQPDEGKTAYVLARRDQVRVMRGEEVDDHSLRLGVKAGNPEAWKIEKDGEVFINDATIPEVSIKKSSTTPASLGDVYQDLVANLKLYNELARKERAPLFDLLQVGTNPK